MVLQKESIEFKLVYVFNLVQKKFVQTTELTNSEIS